MKYFGKVGYSITEEQVIDGKTTGVWEEKIVEKQYFGDVIKTSTVRNQGSGINDNIDINNQVSIVADAFAYANFSNMRYVTWMGSKWEVKTVTVERPRITISIGGVYNEEQA